MAMVNLARAVLRASRRFRINGVSAARLSGFICTSRGGIVNTDLGLFYGHDRFKEVRGFHVGMPEFCAEEDSNGPNLSPELSEKEFHDVANETLNHLQEKVEEVGDQLSVDGFDSDYSEGVLTVRLGDLGTYVINKQTPNRQIWLSSPVSGPSRFDWQDSKWVYRRTKAELQSLLQKELTDLLGRSVNLG